MIQINSAIGVLVFLVGVALVSTIAVNIHTQILRQRCIAILVVAYCWLEQIRQEQQEVANHEGTD